MFERFTERARMALAEAGQLAKELRSPAIRRHHLLIALVDAANEGSESVAAVLADAGVDPGEFRGALIESLKASEKALEDAPAKQPFSAESKKALELSLREALSLGHNYIGREHLLLGVLRDPDGPLADALSAAHLSHKRAREIVSQQSPPSRVAARQRRMRGREFRVKSPRFQTPGLQEVLHRAYGRAGRDRAANTGDLLVALLETSGTHFAEAVSSWNLDPSVITAEVDRLCASAAPDGGDRGVKIDESGAVSFSDPRVVEELKRLAGEGPVTPEQLIVILGGLLE